MHGSSNKLSTLHPAAGPTGQGWLPKDLNEGRLDLFFLLLAVLMALNLLLFLWVAMKYEYKAIEHVRRVAVRPVSWDGRGKQGL